MSEQSKIVVVGSLNADLTIYTDRLPAPGETVRGEGFAVNPGGKSANQAAAAGRLGARVALLGAVGADPNGAMLLDAARTAGVDTSAVRQEPGEATGVAVISVDVHGENSIIISAGANALLSPSDVDDSAGIFDGAAVVCLCLEVPLATVLAAAWAGRRAGATVILNLSPYGPVPAELLAATDILLVNVHEAASLLGGTDPAADWELALATFAARGLARVIVTLGGDGSMVLDSTAPDGARIVPIAPTKVEVVDTTGSGDAFTGAVAARLAAGDTLAGAARYASVAAALAATGKGAQQSYPSHDDVAARLS